MYVTTSVTHKPEVRIDLLTFMQVVNNFALERYSKLCSFHNLSVNRYVCKLPCVSKRLIVPGIIDLPQFSYEDLEEIVADGQGSFHIGNASRYIHTHYVYAIAFIVYSIQGFRF